MDYELKQKILNAIEEKVDFFEKKSPTQYLIRCPICGDSDDHTHAHCYVKCSYDANEPLLYNCFKANCNARGVVNKYFLSKLGVTMNGFSELENDLFNKISNTKKDIPSIADRDPVVDSDQIGYIEYRLGEGFSIDDYRKFRIIWDMSDIISNLSNKKIINSLPNNRNSISFLSSDGSLLLTRFFEDGFIRWKKIKLFPYDGNVVYTIKSSLDLFTTDTVTLNIGEGIFDVLSIYKNFSSTNSVYIATLDSSYLKGIDYAISKGIIGNNVVVRVYIDSNINRKDICNKLKNYKWMFKNISIIANIKAEDVGHKIEEIKLMEYKV